MQVAVGVGSQDLAGLTVPFAGSLAGRVYATGKPLRVSHPSEEPGLASIASGSVDVGPVLVVPLTGAQKVIGVLSVARLTGRAAFTADELDMAAGFANQASIAIELADARTEQQRCVMDEERDRIAADLHDHVIQRLFAIGLALQSIAATLPPTPTAPDRAPPRPHASPAPSTTWTTRSVRSAPPSSPCTTWPNPLTAGCAGQSWTSSPR